MNAIQGSRVCLSLPFYLFLLKPPVTMSQGLSSIPHSWHQLMILNIPVPSNGLCLGLTNAGGGGWKKPLKCRGSSLRLSSLAFGKGDVDESRLVRVNWTPGCASDLLCSSGSVSKYMSPAKGQALSQAPRQERCSSPCPPRAWHQGRGHGEHIMTNN